MRLFPDVRLTLGQVLLVLLVLLVLSVASTTGVRLFDFLLRQIVIVQAPVVGAVR